MDDNAEGINIKVEPLSPSSFPNDHHSSTNKDNESVVKSPNKNHVIQPMDVHSAETDNKGNQAIYTKAFSDFSNPSQMHAPYSYQSSSMPVFPSMPYSSSYSYLPDKQSSLEGANYSAANGEHSGALHTYNIQDTVGSHSFNEIDSNKPSAMIGKKSHLPKRYKCAMCAYRTRYKSDLNRHVRKHAIATFNCDICNMPFKTVGNVEFHKRKEHAHLLVPTTKEILKYSCKMCTYSTMYSSDLTRHIRKHYVAKFHCTLCNKPFMTSGSLVHHKRSVHDVQDVEVVMGLEGVESIKQTGEIIRSDDELDEKADVNGNINRVDEEMSAIEESENNSHIRSPGKPGDKYHDHPLITMKDMDNNEDESESNKLQQMTSLSTDEVYNYEEPELETTAYINNGSKGATGESGTKTGNNFTKHTCPHCDKSFGRKLVLDYHLKNIHKICSQVNGDYVEYPDDYDLALDISIQELENSTSDSQKHIVSSTKGQLRHKCPFCAYATNYKSTFDRHVRKHELACHICTVCRMPFITFGHLQRHIRDNHPNHYQKISKKEITVEKQRCTYCEYEADSLQQLRMHCEVDHGQVILQEIQRSAGTKKVVPRVSQSNFVVATPDVSKAESSNSGYVSLSDSMNSTPNQSCNTIPKTNPRFEEGVSNQPPSGRRYAKLISDFDDFASRPFACALCFYRTSDLSVLVKHTENHLTGCNTAEVPETARLSVSTIKKSRDALQETPRKQSEIDMSQVQQILSQPVYTVQKDAATHGGDVYKFYKTRAMSHGQSKPTTPSPGQGSHSKTPGNHQAYPIHPNITSQSKANMSVNHTRLYQSRPCATSLSGKDSNLADRLIPTFSVHYRKDKTNMTRPYLCLLCRKRFRHLTLLKQHFRQIHSNTNVLNNQKFECQMCKETFNSPMALQEHHELNH